MKFQAKYLVPSVYELIGTLFATGVVLLLINSSRLLAYYGLTASSQVLHDSTAQKVTTGLHWFDGFRFTDSIVTFLIWSIVGILCLSIIQSFTGMYAGLRRDRQLSSNRYVHPTTFSRTVFWRRLVLETVIFFICLTLFLSAIYVAFSFVLPTALAYSRTYLVGFNLAHLGNLLIGALLLYVWLIVLLVLGRALLRYRSLFQ